MCEQVNKLVLFSECRYREYKSSQKVERATWRYLSNYEYAYIELRKIGDDIILETINGTSETKDVRNVSVYFDMPIEDVLRIAIKWMDEQIEILSTHCKEYVEPIEENIIPF